MKHDIESYKQNAIEFYFTAYMGEPAEAVKRYVGAKNIQHNPSEHVGKEGFIDYFEEMTREYPYMEN